MIESSRDPAVASTIDRAVPAGKTMTIVLGSVPCSIVSLRGVEARGEAAGDAIGFVGVCVTRGAAGNFSCALGITKAVVSDGQCDKPAAQDERHDKGPPFGDPNRQR